MLSAKESNTEEDVINLISDIAHMKSSLVEYVTSQHSTFDCNDALINELSDKFETVHERSQIVITESEKTCGDLNLTTEDREKFKNQIDNLVALRTTVVDLIELDKLVRNFQVYETNDLELSLDVLKSISRDIIALRNVLVRSSFTLRVQENKVYQTLLASHFETKVELIARIKDMWHSKVLIERHGNDPYYDYKNPEKTPQLVPLSKSVVFDMPTEMLQELIYLMYNLDIGSEILILLMKFVTEELIYPIVLQFKDFALSTKTDKGKISLSLFSRLPDDSHDDTYQAVVFMDDLTKALDVLYDNILVIPNNEKQTEYLVAEVQKSMFGERLIDALIEDFIPCLFSDFDNVRERLCAFNDTLLKHRCIDPGDTRLKNYIDNYEHHVNESNELTYLAVVRGLCLSSILQSRFRSLNIFEEFRDLRAEDIMRTNPGSKKLIDLSALSFPPCEVSNSVIEIMVCIGEGICKFSNATDDKAEAENCFSATVNFLRTLPLMATMYLSVVPMSNKRELESLPRAAALHYNNCMYIAHHCMMISPSIQSLVNDIDPDSLTNMDDKLVCKNAPHSLIRLIYMLRYAAGNALTKEFNKQRLQLHEFFEDMDDFTGIGIKERRAEAGNIIKKCVLHLRLLSEAYLVLPLKVYDSFFGGLLVNEALTLAVSRVLAMSDIVNTDGREIVTLIQNFCQELESIEENYNNLRNGQDVQRVAPSVFMAEQVSCWSRVQSLLFMLKSGLMEIEERYADGKGPLAIDFKGQELRSLIQALFKKSAMRNRVIEGISV